MRDDNIIQDTTLDFIETLKYENGKLKDDLEQRTSEVETAVQKARAYYDNLMAANQQIEKLKAELDALKKQNAVMATISPAVNEFLHGVPDNVDSIVVQFRRQKTEGHGDD